MATEDGNRQDMSVQDVQHAALAATEEGQDVASLNRIVVGMPAFTDPHNPMSQSGSVNLPLDRHPVTHSEDYGTTVEPGEHVFAVDGEGDMSPHAVGALTLSDEQHDKLNDLPEDREDWTKAHWQLQARAYDLPTSGNIDTIRGRVEDHEATEEATEARSSELQAMKREDLDALAGDYDIDPAEYSRKEDLAEAILTAEREQD